DLDSDANVTTGKTNLYALGGADDNTTVSAGLIAGFQGLVAAPSFWAGANGQNLIKLLNVTLASKSGTSTSLGSWLSKNWGNIYNIKTSPNYFFNKTTAQIAARFLQMYASAPTGLDVQVLSTALSIYVTTTGLNSAALAQNS